MTAPAKRRPMINNLLKDLQPGKWIDIDELIRLLQTKDEYLFAMVNYAWRLYLLDQHYGQVTSMNMKRGKAMTLFLHLTGPTW
jgi:hypothetical protein